MFVNIHENKSQFLRWLLLYSELYQIKTGSVELRTTLFNIFLDRIMTDPLGDHVGTFSIGGNTVTNLCFADVIDGLAGDEQDLSNPVNHLNKTYMSYGMEISTDKIKLMTNKINQFHQQDGTNIRNSIQLQVPGFSCHRRYEILSRIAQTTAMLTKLKPIWKDKNITLRSKIRLMRPLAISIFIYARETWTLTSELQRRVQAIEIKCYRKIYLT